MFVDHPRRSFSQCLVGSLLVFSAAPFSLQAQRLSGRLSNLDEQVQQLVLFDTKGGEHAAIDSCRVDRKGHFEFRNTSYAKGFYQLSVNDSDRVDIILDPREPEVELDLDGSPLQEHIVVVRSTENQRLWEYKWLSRRSQARLQEIQSSRIVAAPTDTALLKQLERAEKLVRTEQKAGLDRLVEQDTSSYFGKVVKADRALMAAIPFGFRAIKDSFGWNDPELLRTSIYSKAALAVLQNPPLGSPDGMLSACDSLLYWSAEDPACWTHMRAFLLRMFAEFGPDHIAQHLVDRYVVGPGAIHPPEPDLLLVAADLLRVTIGSHAPDITLIDPLKSDTLELKDLLPQGNCTALFFYSSTCDHCHAQMPGLRDLYASMKDRGFQLLGIALDGDTTEFRTTILEEGLNWPCFSELSGWGSAAAKAFAVKSTPAFFLVDTSGMIIGKPVDHIALRALVEERLR